MAKITTKQIIEYLKEAGASEEDIPVLAMTAYYESNFNTLAKNTETDALGLYQINASSFFINGKPDETLKSFAGDISLDEFETKLEDPQYNTSFAVHYLDVIKKDLEDGKSQFGMVRDNDNDPFAVWEAYTTYVKPFVSSMKLPGRGNTDEEKMQDITTGIGVYTDAMLDINNVGGLKTTEQSFDVIQGQSATPIQTATMSKETIPEPGNPSTTQSATMIREVIPESDNPIPAEGKLGMERRATGYSQREVSRFNKAVDKIAAMINKVEGSDNPETKRQVQIILGQELGFDMDNLPQPQRSSYDEVDRTIIDFVAELGKQKAKLGG